MKNWASRRGRTSSIVLILVGAAGVLIASTQTWAIATVEGTDITASGSQALALLQPLALAGLALTLALALVGKVTRFIFAALAVVIGVALCAISIPVATSSPVSAVARAVTDHTGIAGIEGVSSVVSHISFTVWPLVTIIAAVVLTLGGLLALVTGAAWRKGTSRYDAQRAAAHSSDGPLDAVHSWDDLTRGDDPST